MTRHLTRSAGLSLRQARRDWEFALMAWHTESCMAETLRHLTVSGDVAGEYIVDEELPDGRLVIRADTSAAAIRRRAGLEEISADDFAEHFGQLPTDDEG